MSRFVRPETAVLKISSGDTLTVKRRLNHGEQRAAFARMYVAGAAGVYRVDTFQIGMARTLAYLLDWSLTDDDGKLVAIRDQPIETVTTALDALDPESFAEIRDAIEAHEEAMALERVQEKNALGDEMKSSAISISPDAVAGGSSGSVN